MPLPRFYPRLWPSVSPCPPPLAPPRHLRPGPNPNPTARCSSPRYAFAGTPPTHTGTDAPPHPRIHHVPRFASPTRHAAAPPSANHAVETNRNRSVDGTETKSTSITCVAPAPGPTERPGRVTTYNRPALGPHAQRQPTLRTIDNNALAAPRRPVEH